MCRQEQVQVPNSAWGSQSLPSAAAGGLQHSLTNLASCQVRTRKGPAVYSWPRGALGTPVKEMG